MTRQDAELLIKYASEYGEIDAILIEDADGVCVVSYHEDDFLSAVWTLGREMPIVLDEDEALLVEHVYTLVQSLTWRRRRFPNRVEVR